MGSFFSSDRKKILSFGCTESLIDTKCLCGIRGDLFGRTWHIRTAWTAYLVSNFNPHCAQATFGFQQVLDHTNRKEHVVIEMPWDQNGHPRNGPMLQVLC